jgi:hypothetical protein
VNRRLWIPVVVTVVAVGTVLGVRGTDAGASSTVHPRVSALTASPTTLGAVGGTVVLGAQVSGASSCTFSSTTSVVGLPATVACSSGPVADTVTLPANSGRKAERVKVTLSVTGGRTARAKVIVTVDAPTTSVDTAAALEAAHWAPNVSVTSSSGSVVISSDGLPSTVYWTRPSEYAVPDGGVVVPTAATAQVAPDPTKASPITLTVPAVPTWSTKTTPTAGGAIGITVSGAALFDPYEGDGTTVALASNFTITDAEGNPVSFVDGCNGHPSPTGEYHYHGLPTCITDVVDGSTGPSHIIGVALDGFPIYGDRDINGNPVPASSLDGCDGIFSATPEFPSGIYHYVLPDVTTAQSSLRCFHGKVAMHGAALAALAKGCGSTGRATDLVTAYLTSRTRRS